MSEPPRRIETAIVGAGQAGLAMSSLLSQAGREHVVLERRERLGGGWQDRWDSFCLVTPNWTASFPGFPYEDDDPDGFMPRDAIAARIARFAEVIGAPVRLGVAVSRLTRNEAGAGFSLTTSSGPLSADRVIVASGGFHVPRISSAGASLPARVFQLHSHGYHNPEALPPGAVLLIGSGQTGVQIAEELRDAGRQVFLSAGRCGRIPRRYRGRDFFHWLWSVRTHGEPYGIRLPTLDELPDPKLRFACNPHLSGHAGGHDTDLRRFAADGMTLIGRFEGADGERARFAPDLRSTLAFADRFFDERFRPLFDQFIERAGVAAPPDDAAPFAFEPPEVTELNLAIESISTVIWTSGYRLDYGWIEQPIFDANGVPRQVDGQTEVPGLSFIGLPWLRDQGSATLFGVGRDATRLAERLEAARASA